MRIMAFCFVAVLVFVSVRPGMAEDDDTRAVTVSGTGTVVSPPDQVVFRISVTTEGNDLLETRRESDSELQAILKLGEMHGVQADDFRVTQLKISYGFDEDRRRFFYRVDREASMTLKQIAHFDALLAAALQRGGFNITEIAFGTSKGEALQSEARGRAVAAARGRAQQLAELNGLKLGTARVISEGQFSQQPFVTTVVPVVGARTPRRAGNTRPAQGFFSIPDRESLPALRVPTQPARSVQPAAREEDEPLPQVPQGPGGLGAIETTVDVTIEFELLLEAP